MIISILEDDKDLTDLMQAWLITAGHQCHFYRSGREFIKSLPFTNPHLVILDWNVPGLSGLEVMRWMKASEFDNTPIIFATTRSSVDDLTQALGDGADDYVIKPLRQGELMARITAVSRPYKINQEPIDHKPFNFDPHQNTVRIDGSDAVIKLTHKEYEVAQTLFTYPNKVFSRDMLLESIWGKFTAVSTRTIDTHISRVRVQLQLDGTHGWELISVYGKGYKLSKK
ncbi:response regulator transcription factor [Marinicella sp. W31]|uniref:response regulator transcription factor n=1 Tax=Marinicella sp. W31 TaxID=3023713 RepID=UPI003757CE1A